MGNKGRTRKKKTSMKYLKKLASNMRETKRLLLENRRSDEQNHKETPPMILYSEQLDFPPLAEENNERIQPSNSKTTALSPFQQESNRGFTDLKNVSYKLENRDHLTVHSDNSQHPVIKKLPEKRKLSQSSGVLNEIEDHELIIESAHEADIANGRFDAGHRIIDFDHFTAELKRISEHDSLFQCNLSMIHLTKEIQKGLNSEFFYKCSMCKKEFKIKNSHENLNKNTVTGAMVAGCGHAQVQNLTAALDLPNMTSYIYEKSHDEICQDWELTAWDEMKKAGEEERLAAIAEGRVNKDGIAEIDVIIDGCWCKRSYRTNYAALSGAAAIVGRRFGKVLFYAVKNKYCCICARAEKRGETCKNHKCYKNFTGPSTAMESDILVEGFRQSVGMHNIIYSRYIADGDSSTYAKILEARPYPNVTVEKISCRNHILRNFCNKLQQLKNDSRFDAKQKKLVTTERILSARKYICLAIKYHHENRQPNSVANLHRDINISIQHAYSNHIDCNKMICNKKSQQEKSEIFKFRIWSQMRIIVANVASLARSLVENVDSNVVERFNGVIAKFVGGKRVNYALKRSYQGRCAGAVISFNSGKIYTTVHKKIRQDSPSKRMKLFEERKENQRQYNNNIIRKKNRNLIQKKTDLNYGENVDSPDMDAETFELAKATFLNNLIKTDDQRQDIQESTKLQSESGEWMELRRKLLTSSNFGKVIKRRKTNSCANMVKNMLYRPSLSHVMSINHGLMNESTARDQLSEILNETIDLCGLFIDKEQPFLGASPDGFIKNINTLVEIKCPVAPYKMGMDEAIKNGKMHFWKTDKKTGQVYVNKNSDWYMQVQGQMHISGIPKCILAAWYGDKKIKMEVIEKDDKFWQESMEPKLSAFYFDCLLPELVDPRFTRGRAIREPAYVTIKKTQKPKENYVNKENIEIRK